jgi:hypothetical protein
MHEFLTGHIEYVCHGKVGNKTVRHPLKKTVRHQDISAPVEKDSSAPRDFGTVEKKCQIGTAFSFKQT